MTNSNALKKTPEDKTSYDDLPYENFSFSYCSPEHLYTIAKIFQLDAPDITTARVLDLGCGMGGNIIGHAVRYSKAHVVGIDLSKVQIEQGQKNIKELGLTNIELKHMSIADIDDSLGQFDYIICHGVFTWVPKEVQNKILEVIQKHLTPKGVSYVSYNTLPGWNIATSFKEMLQFHADKFTNDNDKIAQARAFLEFITDGLQDSTTPYYKFLKDEANIINAADNSYLKHEYLDKGNSQFYFHEFMSEASKYDLQYLADTHLSTMYSGNLPEKARDQLQTITDIVRMEQYMDFIRNRRFRSTLLIKNGNKLQRNITSDALNKMWISMNITPVTPVEKADFTDKALKVEFIISNSQARFTITGSIMCAAMYAISSFKGGYISIDEIIEYVKSKCSDFNPEQHIKYIKMELIGLLFKGLLSVRAVKPITADKISDKPKISKLALSQINNNAKLIFNQLNDSIPVSSLQRVVMQNLDGKNTVDQIANNVAASLDKSDSKLSIDGKTVTDPNEQSKLIKDLINSTLQFCWSYSFLVG